MCQFVIDVALLNPLTKVRSALGNDLPTDKRKIDHDGPGGRLKSSPTLISNGGAASGIYLIGALC